MTEKTALEKIRSLAHAAINSDDDQEQFGILMRIIELTETDTPPFAVGEYYVDDDLELIYLITERNTKMAHVKVLDDKKMRHDLFHLRDIKGDKPATAEQIAMFKRADQFAAKGRKLDEFRVGDYAQVINTLDLFTVRDVYQRDDVVYIGDHNVGIEFSALECIIDQTAEELQEVEHE